MKDKLTLQEYVSILKTEQVKKPEDHGGIFMGDCVQLIAGQTVTLSSKIHKQ